MDDENTNDSINSSNCDESDDSVYSEVSEQDHDSDDSDDSTDSDIGDGIQASEDGSKNDLMDDKDSFDSDESEDLSQFYRGRSYRRRNFGQRRGCGSRGRGSRGRIRCQRGMSSQSSRGIKRGKGGHKSAVDLPRNCKSIMIKDTTIHCPFTIDEFCPLRDPGPYIPLDTATDPLALFELYFDEYIVKQIIESTLAYAYHKQDDLVDSFCKFIKKHFTKAELYCYFGALILLGIHGVRNHRYAWSIQKAQNLVRLNELLTCERFELIGTFLHLVTPEQEQALSGNKLSKILPIHNHMKSKCAELYQPCRNLSIDERMVKCKGRTHFRQYLRNKPTKWGFKYWVLTDITGYTIDFDLYSGKATQVSR